MNRFSYIKECVKKNTTSAEYNMQDAAIELLLDGKEDISVRTLIDRAGVERTTFYAYYDRIEDVYEAAENTIIADMLKASEAEDFEKYIENMFSVFAENRKSIKALLMKANRFSLYRKMLDAVRFYLSSSITREFSSQNEAREDMASAALISPLSEYVIEERDIDLRRIEEGLKRLLEA